jgi:hypothetical protein
VPSDRGVWISAILTDAIELRLETLKRDQLITAALRLRISPTAPLGRDLTTRARLSWAGRENRLSNVAPLVVARAPESLQPAVLAIDPAVGGTAPAFLISYGGFASNERVSLWYHRDGAGAVGLGEARADASGRAVYRLEASALDAGRYTIVAAGQYSQVSAVGTLIASDSQPAPSPAAA